MSILLRSKERKFQFLSTLIFLILILSYTNLSAQDNLQKGNVYVDTNGVMRWESDNSEVHGFGVNYTVPFAHAYRSAKRMGIDPKKAIENDVYHFSRLGFNLYRVHVWDTEISDVEGNLIENEHLDAFDFLIQKLKEKDINFMITPIAFWGNGWPESDENTPGFSHKYGKDKCLTNPEAIKAQQNYLTQFLNHVNPYTGVAYKDEQNIIAFEVSNEPHHKGEGKEVTKFIKGMVKAIKKTGTKKPIFYNISHGVHFVDDYFKAGIQGGTFQWYPTGLGYQRELPGNLLPNVNEYEIPFDTAIKKHHGAKLVYEFDAADVLKSYIYPVMARSFREAGIQIATQFAYDPTFLAYANTEYNTHYMNLAYTPQKALSLMICSEVFHNIPMYKNYGSYPENLSFDKVKVSYLNNLAEYNSEDKFIYTNHTESKPVDENKLSMIAGYGESTIVKYDGLGAYFLDKIDDGVWRLEVMPDAILVDNPFGRNSPKKTVSVINRKSHKIQIQLNNLGKEFKIEGVNKDNNKKVNVTNASFEITPGTYMLTKKGTEKNWSANDGWKQNKLNDFYAPETTVKQPWFKHKPKVEITENIPLTIEADYIAPNEPEEMQLLVYSNGKSEIYDMVKAQGYSYYATIPAKMLTAGYLSYSIVVKQDENSFITYPASKEGHMFDWDFYDKSTYKVRVVPSDNPIYLFNAVKDTDLLVKEWRKSFRLVPTKNESEAEYQMNIEKLFIPDVENLNAQPIYDYSFKHFIIDKIEGRKKDLPLMKNLIFKGRSLNDKSCKLQIAFVMDNGAAYGKVIELGTEINEYNIDLSSLKPVKTVTLPRPYPSFLPYYLDHTIASGFNIKKVESIQFSIGPEIPESELKDKHGIGIISVRLE
ncbi:cellulase family glycosylhydrolase [Lutibacter sp. B1]|uniref:cellulase family glycosylhydrolase n=1 Tax=Lutibacter sp. B1 TaxID=2725996 RepID=UPI001456EF1E|nr:cellulase family glycosylhydrolase [Lutibacter sp. B1]NLP59233.1 cellulase family glycosylhydrolase [Lutibacter sp. B1]